MSGQNLAQTSPYRKEIVRVIYTHIFTLICFSPFGRNLISSLFTNIGALFFKHTKQKGSLFVKIITLPLAFQEVALAIQIH